MFTVRRQLWLILGVETVFFVALAAWILVRLDRLLEPVSLIIALTIIVIGDLATVLLMQRFAPTSITFTAGEAEGLFGEVVNGFGKDTHGSVLISGEQWAARLNGSRQANPGDRVRVLSRRGLTLLVERSD